MFSAFFVQTYPLHSPFFRGGRQVAGLIKLCDPPLDTSALNPGYIKGYAPDVSLDGQMQEQLVIPLAD
ncbi:hypothetical protein FACS1894170_00760 [Planctomycetales bacterium]|nr:hypothetical protein FACS1894170_00760 [Planctomycetales bacterium]